MYAVMRLRSNDVLAVIATIPASAVPDVICPKAPSDYWHTRNQSQSPRFEIAYRGMFRIQSCSRYSEREKRSASTSGFFSLKARRLLARRFSLALTSIAKVASSFYARKSSSPREFSADQ